MSVFTPAESRWRYVIVPATLTAAVAHLPVIAPHLDEAPYLGILFIVLASACFVLGAALISADAPIVYLAAAVTCGLAMVGYVLTRTVAMPMIADDVGNWLEPLGVVSMLAEAVVVVSGIQGWRTRSKTPHATAAHRPLLTQAV